MKKITENIKLNLLNEMSEINDPKKLCEKFGICKSTAYNWLKSFRKITYSNNNFLTYSDYYKKQKQLEQKTLELKIFQDLHCFKDASTKEKEIAISKFVGVYPIKTMCRLLEIPKGTFYNYHLRRKTITQNQTRDEWLKQEILNVFRESGERFGAKKIEAKLRANGINTTLHKVQTLMKTLNINSRQQINKIETPQTDNSRYYINKLKRLFNQNAPNKYWVSDVTELRACKNKFYLCVILDLFSRKVIAYRLSSQNNTSLTINTFKDAYESRNRPCNLSFHSDQGSNYTSFEFKELLRFFKVNQSFSKRGNPYDNACMESFFSSFKREEYNSKQYVHFDELEASIASYIKFYNEYRPHQSLKNKTPDQVEEEYFCETNKKIHNQVVDNFRQSN